MGFAVDLLDGFDVLYRRTEGVLKVSTEMANFFKKLSIIEAEYAKVLLKISKSFGQKKLISNPHLDGTVKEAWTSIFQALEAVATKHDSFSQVLMKDFSNGVNDFVKEKDVVRRRLTNDGVKLTKEMKIQLESLSKAKANYIKLSKEAESAAAAVSKGQSESAQQKKLAVLQQKAQQASEKASGADLEYKEALKTTNSKQSDFYTTEMPNLLNEFQQFEEERITFTKTTLSRYATLFQEIPPILQQSVDTVKAGAEQISEQQDINLFVQENKTGVTPPPPIEYQQYDGVLVASMALPTPSTPPTSSSSVGGSSAAPSKIGIYKPPSENLSKEWGITVKDQALTPEQRRAKLEKQFVEIDGQIKSENTTKAGVEKLVQCYVNDLVAQKKAEGELADSERKLKSLQDSKKLINSQLAELGGGQSENASSESAGGAGPNVGAVPVGAAHSNVLRVRGLFDYDATCDTELSFKEGDILAITEQDESGWWYAELNGKVGFIPQNYVEVL